MLNFPNPSRSHDATRHCVRFWGYDGPLEVASFVDEGALLHIARGAKSTEAELLRIFDRNRECIQKAARKAYERRRESSCELIASDL
jgi:hypothetical protein